MNEFTNKNANLKENSSENLLMNSNKNSQNNLNSKQNSQINFKNSTLNSQKSSQKNLNSKTKIPHFSRFLINDFLHSNYAIYQGFFKKGHFEMAKLQDLAQAYNALKHKDLKSNYYAKAFGGLFFSKNDATKLGFIRDDLDTLLHTKQITQKEFYILLASLIYSADRVANTVGHYDAYRKNVSLQDRLNFELIEPLECECEIFKELANALAKTLLENGEKIDIAFIDPPYNSRQYSRFYHLLETLAKNDKPTLYGVARKPAPELISAYCKSEAVFAFEKLVTNLSKFTKILLLTYNNTVSANPRSNTRMNEQKILELLNALGKTHKYEFNFQAFSSGKTNFNNHKEMIFVCEVKA